MNRINRLFDMKEEGDVLSIYFCAGYPTLEGTADVIRSLERNGIDMVEIGIPFSDPMADGKVIQQAATQALRNGMTLRLLFEQLKDIRQTVQIPLVLMGYLNPIIQYGFEPFCRKCVECGIDGVIIPDLPFEDYMRDYLPIAEQTGVRVIMLITPETSEERIKRIDRHTDGFIYMVSSPSITGAKESFDFDTECYFKRVRAMKLMSPCLIGFGISNQSTLRSAFNGAEGAIIGSKFVTLQGEEQDTDTAINRLLRELGI